MIWEASQVLSFCIPRIARLTTVERDQNNEWEHCPAGNITHPPVTVNYGEHQVVSYKWIYNVRKDI